MNMTQVVKARSALGTILSGSNVPEGVIDSLMAAHNALLAFERADPAAQAAAFQEIAGPRDEWEIA